MLTATKTNYFRKNSNSQTSGKKKNLSEIDSIGIILFNNSLKKALGSYSFMCELF